MRTNRDDDRCRAVYPIRDDAREGAVEVARATL